jgi:hypothetical protein
MMRHRLSYGGLRWVVGSTELGVMTCDSTIALQSLAERDHAAHDEDESGRCGDARRTRDRPAAPG